MRSAGALGHAMAAVISRSGAKGRPFAESLDPIAATVSTTPTSMSSAPRILAFCGSSRVGSLNLRLLHAAAAACRAKGAEVTVVTLQDLALPLYDADLEDAQGVPEGARRLGALIDSHAALLIATPEYNATFPPVLANAITWATRVGHNPFSGKIAALLGASPGAFGAVRSVGALRAVLTHLGVIVLPSQCLLPAADAAFDATGTLTHERTQASLAGVAEALVSTAAHLHAARA